MPNRALDAIRWKRSFVAVSTARGFSAPDAIRAVLRRGGYGASASRLILSRLRRAPDGSRYFDVGGWKLFFLRAGPDGDALEGAVTILKEAFLEESDFFSGEVAIRPGDTVLDLGGNIGTSALLFSGLVGETGRVFSFEPVFHDVLARNLRENGVRNVSVVPVGVAQTAGTATFAVTGRGIDSRLVENGRAVDGGVSVPMTTLDAFAAERGLDRIDFIKMDIEGAEEMALRGATEIFARFRPKLSIASYHTEPTGERQHPKLVRFLGEWGYRVEEVGARRIYAWHPEAQDQSLAA